MTTKEDTTKAVIEDWRESDSANEIRKYIDTFFKPKKQGIVGIDREIIVNEIANELTTAKKQILQEVLEKVRSNTLGEPIVIGGHTWETFIKSIASSYGITGLD